MLLSLLRSTQNGLMARLYGPRAINTPFQVITRGGASHASGHNDHHHDEPTGPTGYPFGHKETEFTGGSKLELRALVTAFVISVGYMLTMYKLETPSPMEDAANRMRQDARNKAMLANPNAKDWRSFIEEQPEYMRGLPKSKLPHSE